MTQFSTPQDRRQYFDAVWQQVRTSYEHLVLDIRDTSLSAVEPLSDIAKSPTALVLDRWTVFFAQQAHEMWNILTSELGDRRYWSDLFDCQDLAAAFWRSAHSWVLTSVIAFEKADNQGLPLFFNIHPKHLGRDSNTGAIQYIGPILPNADINQLSMVVIDISDLSLRRLSPAQHFCIMISSESFLAALSRAVPHLDGVPLELESIDVEYFVVAAEMACYAAGVTPERLGAELFNTLVVPIDPVRFNRVGDTTRYFALREIDLQIAERAEWAARRKMFGNLFGEIDV